MKTIKHSKKQSREISFSPITKKNELESQIQQLNQQNLSYEETMEIQNLKIKALNKKIIEIERQNECLISENKKVKKEFSELKDQKIDIEREVNNRINLQDEIEQQSNQQYNQILQLRKQLQNKDQEFQKQFELIEIEMQILKSKNNDLQNQLQVQNQFNQTKKQETQEYYKKICEELYNNLHNDFKELKNLI